MKNVGSIPAFHPAGWPFMAGSVLLALILAFVGGFFFVFGLVVMVWCFYFFRDPDRFTPLRGGLIVSPADGRIVGVQEVVPEPTLGLGDTPRTRISIFLNIFNVHVNRIPADGKVITRRYRPGKFFNASLDKASDENERMALTIALSGENPHAGEKIGVVQIAGLVARRIQCDAQEEQLVKSGERYGIIRFGSRVDLYLPVGVAPLVSFGQTMVGGETVLADLLSNEAPRVGEVRP